MPILGRVFRSSRPDGDFLQLLQAQAGKTLEGLQALEQYAKTGDAAHAEKVRVAEVEEDELRRILIDELNRTFVTPIDREDIFALSRALDDVLDYAYTTVDEMVILNVEPDGHVIKMARVLREAAEALNLACQTLKTRPQVANDHAVRAKQLENQAETMYREAVRELFEGITELPDVVRVLKMREVYRHLSNAADRGDEAANVIGDIVVKMT
jgi:predicted phosphate transport protein (TIGR00153 family)